MVKRVEICFVLDETGSMGRLRQDTIGSFNGFLEDQRKLAADVTFSLTQFSLAPGEDTYRVRCQCVLLADVERLTEETYRPRGMTPLLDAVGGTIDSVGARLAAMEERDRPDQVIVVVLTDGEENSSHEYTLERVREMVARQRDAYKWEFVFLGVGFDEFDAHAVAGAMGISGTYTTAVSNTTMGIKTAYRYASAKVASLVGDDEPDSHVRTTTGDMR